MPSSRINARICILIMWIFLACRGKYTTKNCKGKQQINIHVHNYKTEHNESPRLAPRHAASPSGVVGEPAGQATHQSSNPSPLHPTSLASPLPTWASVIKGSVAASVGEPVYSRSAPSISAADFSALYELCMKSGLKARVAFHHAAGRQTVTVMCTLPASTTSAAPAGKRCRRRCRHTRRGRAAAERDTHMRPQPSSPTATAPVCDDPPPRSTPTPPPPSPPVAASPPAKRVRRR
jgi:hypothetical protein